MRRPRIHEQIASADETTTTKKKIGIAVRGQKGAADARTDRRRSNRSISCRSGVCFLRARSRARRH